MKRIVWTAMVVAAAGVPFGSTAEAAVIKDFNSGIGSQVNHPHPTDGGTNALNVWHDITNDAFSSVAADTLDGSPALRIVDGGFTNGVYIIYSGVVPATGTYTLSAAMKVTEDPAQLNSIRAFQMGVVANGAHRGLNPSDLATINPAAPGSGIARYSGLTTGNDNALATQTITTDEFTANAGDTLLVAFSTDLDTGDFDTNSATWGAGGFVTVDNLDLTLVPEPASATLLGLAGATLLATRRRRPRGAA